MTVQAESVDDFLEKISLLVIKDVGTLSVSLNVLKAPLIRLIFGTRLMPT